MYTSVEGECGGEEVETALGRISVEVQLEGSDPAQRVPHGHGLPQGGQHLVPVGDAHATGLWANDHMTQVFAPAVLRGLGHGHPQG